MSTHSPPLSQSVEVQDMTALETLVEPLKRELAVPGVFEASFPSTDDDSLQASLADGFAQAQLWGFFGTIALSETNGDFETTPDISAAGGALILAFSATRIIRAQLRGMTTMERYKAGPVEFETQHSANLLKGELDYLQKYLDELIVMGQRAANAKARLVTVLDNYWSRVAVQTYGSYYPYELVAPGAPGGLGYPGDNWYW